MRLFVAADLPEDVRRRLAGHGRALADVGGWRGLDAAVIHVTLVFLGERPEAAVAPIAAALEAAWRPVGGLSLGGELRLPPRRPRVAAIAVEDSRGELAALQADVSARLAGVAAELIERDGAVSPEVAAALADGALAAFGADFGIGITGVAGPGGGTDDKPVGTVCLSVAARNGRRMDRRALLPGDRAMIRQRTTTLALHMLRALLEGRRDLPGR